MIPQPILENYPELSTQSIIIAYRGSIAHGMYVPQDCPDSIDDKDIMAVSIAKPSFYFGFEYFGETSRATIEIKEREWDIVIYEFKKFINLLAKGNPNVLSMLWLNPIHYLKLTEAGKILINNKNIFVSKQVYHSFVGYAYDQLYKMEHLAYKGYMGEKRKQLVEKFGYDTKNAAHLVRLLTMAIEFLTEGVLYVERKDAAKLLDIKRGNWPLDKVKEEAEYLFRLAKEAYVNSKLPIAVDYTKINKLCVDILKNTIG